jgi:hypothetical protein
MRDLDVALVSCRTLPEPDPDAPLLTAALEAAGLRTRTLAWDDPEVEWSRAALTVLRSAWNYPLHAAEFLRWAEEVSGVSDLCNPAHVVRWNHHKRYLCELGEKGIPVVPTVVVPRGAHSTLGEILTEQGWDEAVVKPAISAASYRTMRVGAGNRQAGEEHLRTLTVERDALVQRYLASVEDYGERSLIWIDGILTHAVRKDPRFAGQEESVSPTQVAIAPAEADLADALLRTAPGPLLYARIDVAPGPDGRPVVMELELIEPSLFFVQYPQALENFVAASQKRLG